MNIPELMNDWYTMYLLRESEDPEMFYYQPSCSFNEMDPVSAKALIQYARSKNMKVRACCKFDKNILTDEDTAIYFCQACREYMETQGYHTKSFWEILDEDSELTLPDYSGMKFVIQDCWRDREHPEIHQAVRSLLNKMHIEFAELPHNKEHSDFCGTLHFETERYRHMIPSPDHLTHYGDEMAKKLMEEKVSQLNGMPVITCCARCYKGYILGGGHPVHLMTLLTGNYTGREKELEERTIRIMSRPDPRYNLRPKQ